MIPTPGTDAGRVTQAALHFIGERNCRDGIASTRTHTLRYRQDCGNVVARMRRFFGKISVVVIEIADTTSRCERRPIGWRLTMSADNVPAMLPGKFDSKS